jgi:hypothetical protein
MDSGPGPLADFSHGEYFLHWCPVGLNPSSVMTAVPMRGNADLGEFEFRTTFDLGDIKNCNRVVIRPPGDLGFVMPNYTFATPVLGGQLTVGVPIKRSVATVAGDRVGCFQSQVVGIGPGRLQPAKRFGKAR